MASDMLNTLNEALNLARAGLPVFPLWGVIERDGEMWDCKTGERADKESGKVPKGSWPTQATTNEETINQWFNEDPQMNYGVKMGGGWLAIDCDTEEATENFLFALDTMCLDEDGEPIDLQPYVVKTGRGHHFYFRGHTTNKVALREGLDVRGDGGYVVGPGSRSWLGPVYTHTAGSLETAPQIPGWLLPKEDLRTRETGLLGSLEAPTIGQGARNDALFRIAANMVSHGVDKETVKVVIRRVNETQCDPPLTDQELDNSIFVTIDKPEFQYSASIQGLLDLAEYKWSSELFHQSEDQLSSREFMLKSDLALLPKPIWIIKDRVPNRGVLQMHGRSYTGKTFVAIDMVMSMMNGVPWLGMDFKLDVNNDGLAKDCVLYVLTEGLFDFRQRLDGWRKHKGGDYDRLITLPERPYNFADASEWDRLFLNMEEDERVREMASRIGMVVIDTQSNAITVNENDNNEMARVASTLRRMSAKMRCPILLIHHDPLGQNDEGGQRQTNRIGGRGAGSFGAAMDVVMALDPPGRGAEDSTLTWSKIKAAKAPEVPTMFRLVDVELSADTSTAVCEDGGLNAILAGGTPRLIDEVASILMEEPDHTARWGQVYGRLGFSERDPRVRNLREQVNQDPRFVIEKGTGRGNYYTVALTSSLA